MKDFGSQAKYTVYCHTLFDGRKYFGKTSQAPSRRWRGNGEGYNGTPFYEAIKEHGWQAFDHEIIATGLTEAQAKVAEENLIKQYGTQDRENGFNVTGGDGWKNPTEEQSGWFSDHLRAINTGRKHTDEYKRRMSERMKGEKNPNAGGKLMTPERVEWFRGYASKPKTEAQKQHMSESARKRRVQCVETGEVFESMKEAAEKMCVGYTTISCAVYNSKRRAAGYHWRAYEGL